MLQKLLQKRVHGWRSEGHAGTSVTVLTKNLELAAKEVTLAASVDKELANHLVGDALENVVSAFDGFGREICARKGANIQFQNLVSARRRVQDVFAVDFADVLSPSDWDHACRVFQKRHLLAHRMGVVDAEYIQRANDASAVVGRRIAIGPEEATSAIVMVDALGRRLFAAPLAQSA